MKATEVKFGAGQKMSVKRPLRLIEQISGDDALDRGRLKIDSDKAIRIATAHPLLEKLAVKATKLKLDRAGRDGAGDKNLPVWRVDLWAAKLAKPSDQVHLGEVVLSAADGKVLKTDLNIHRVE